MGKMTQEQLADRWQISPRSRVASIGRTLYLDFGNEDWQAVAITSEGWQVVSHSPARFRRSHAMQGLPMPERHPDGINLLRRFLNVETEADFQMLVAWLLGCFHPKGPLTNTPSTRHAKHMVCINLD